MVKKIQDTCGSEILIRTPNPVVAVHGVPLPEGQRPGRALQTRPLPKVAEALVEMAAELGCAVVDHYSLWTQRQFPKCLPVADPTGLWPRMGDAIHPGYLGHLAFYREIAPLLNLPKYFPWEEVD